jgi:hypothetical protein
VAGSGGTVLLPPDGCGYVGPRELHKMIDGLPFGTTIQIRPEHRQFFNVVRNPGGPLGGETEQFGSVLIMQMDGTGELQDFHRMLTMQLNCLVHTGPRQLGNPVQSFPTQMARVQGQLPPGDPDFDLLRITAGNDFGMPSPGHTTLTRLPGDEGGGQWNVDSFFDIEYRIDFVGAPGGPLGGRSGSTTATIRMQTGQPAEPTGIAPESSPATRNELLVSRPNPFNPSTAIDFSLGADSKVELAVYDANGRLVRMLIASQLGAGRHAITWDGRDDQGSEQGSGSYFIQLTVDGRPAGAVKAVILK